MKKLLLPLLAIASLPAFYVAGALTYATLNDFSPPEQQAVGIANPQQAVPDSTVSFVIWNIGYAGLGKESDFFFDGGTSMRTTEANTRKNLAGILSALSAWDTVDVLMLQEVDTCSRRSYATHQHRMISDRLRSHNATFAINYKVDWVPVPWTDPMGGVRSGLATFSRFASTGAVRHQYPSSFPWPDRIFFLDRCFMEERIPLPDGRELVIINTHMSAFDDGSLKAAEMAYLREHLLAEEAKGSLVVVGGDWNQSAPGTDDGHGFRLPEDFLPGWKWAFDPSSPTNRNLAEAYKPRVTQTHVIDFFLVSPGLSVEEVRGLPMGFEFSDHEPVYLRVRL